MCGFCGFTGQLMNSKEVLFHMMNKIIHRGPDSAGQHSDEKINLCFRRLSIIDVHSGNQPMYNEDGNLVIVFNGEIYNYQELRDELIKNNHIFKTNSDTETLLHGYEEYGAELLPKLRGMFAFAIWDRKEETLFCARDYFGIKPFYYCLVDGQLVFGSEIKSILEYPAYERKLNEAALEQYLSFQYSVLPETFFKGIYKLLPAHYLVFKNNDITITRYWEPEFKEKVMSPDDAVDSIEEIIQDSIKSHMVSDVEVGSFLSSGVDSSFLASCFHGDKTFTVGFEHENYNEIGYAQDLSKNIGITNYNKVITPEEYWEALPKVQYYMDEPLADPSCVPLYYLCNIASKSVKVVLSGEGADELFGGYNIYHEPKALRPVQWLPPGIRKILAGAAKMLPFDIKGKDYLLRGVKPVEERFIGNANIFTVAERSKILRNPGTNTSPQDLTKPFYQKVIDKDDVTKMQYIDMNFWLIGDILLKADKMSMANSLEVRVPFLDRKVMDVAGQLPLVCRINKKNTKHAFRLAANKHIPEEAAQKKKLGFPTPIRIWLREDEYYNKVKESFISTTARQYFNEKELLTLLNDHKNGAKDNSRKIWTVYVFLVWYKQYFENQNMAAYSFGEHP